jgi:hypothetical protein
VRQHPVEELPGQHGRHAAAGALALAAGAAVGATEAAVAVPAAAEAPRARRAAGLRAAPLRWPRKAPPRRRGCGSGSRRRSARSCGRSSRTGCIRGCWGHSVPPACAPHRWARAGAAA